jgi:hypothetical protein
LPAKLDEVTGYKIQAIDLYQSLGKTRNFIQHFAHPEGDLSDEAGEFIYQVIDPLIGHFWNLYAIEYCDDDEPEVYLLEVLIGRGINFRYSADWEEHVKRARQTEAGNDDSEYVE